ncbi:MAG: tetratricopeptide repeat protein [Chitinophagales bacterium]|nr:tetratricopeptide repeat protein [Chitinophagales bacterium]
MSKGHIVFLLVFIFTLLGLYFFGEIKPKETRGLNQAQPQLTESNDFDFSIYVDTWIENLDSERSEIIQELVSSINKDKLSDADLEHLNPLVSELDNLNSGVSGYFKEMVAEINGDKASWLATGDRYANIIGIVENPQLRDAFKDRALKAFEMAKIIDSSDNEIEVRIANVYLESGDDGVMQGVQRLLKVIENEPDNISANMLLGKFGIMSGQFDKASLRLENVVSSQPQNAEALFLLAEAYRGLGRKDDAVNTLLKCKEFVDDAELESEIDAYIERLK